MIDAQAGEEENTITMTLSRFSFVPLSAGLLTAATAFAAVTLDTGFFTDVSASHTNAEAIMYVEDAGIVSGYPDKTFKPDITINRAEFTKIIVKAKYSEEEIDELLMRVRLAAMSDVPSDAWYWRYVAFARAKGIVQGYEDGTFKPGVTINFAEGSKIIAETFGLPVEEGTVWYEGYVHALVSSNAIPLSIDEFSSPLTRGEMAEIVYRIDAGVSTKPSQGYGDLDPTAPPSSSRSSVSSSSSVSKGRTADGCIRSGCSGQICADEDMMSTCEWREEYRCYETARCKRQSDGQCGWTETKELTSCLEGDDDAASCAAVLCPTNTRCEKGECIPLSRTDCEQAGGDWIQYYSSDPNAGTCAMPTTDGGKQCTDGVQCQGDCIAKSESATSGTCSEFDKVMCELVMRDGKATGGVCS